MSRARQITLKQCFAVTVAGAMAFYCIRYGGWVATNLLKGEAAPDGYVAFQNFYSSG